MEFDELMEHLGDLIELADNEGFHRFAGVLGVTADELRRQSDLARARGPENDEARSAIALGLLACIPDTLRR